MTSEPRWARAAGLLSAAVVAAGSVTSGLTATPAYGVAGGTAVAEGTYGFVADVRVGEIRGCSGVLVDPEWIATVGGCFAEGGQAPPTGPPTQATTVTVGRTNLASGTGGQVRTVVDLIPRTDRDLVLARLSAPVADVAPARIGTAAPTPGELWHVAGYGRTATEWVPDRLHAGTFSVGTVTSTTVDITGDATTPASVCRGDAGGPAMRVGTGGVEVVALNSTSWQGGCLAETESRNGATEVRLDNIKDWIRQAVRGGDFVRLPTSAQALDTRSGIGAPAGLRSGGSTTSFSVTGVGGVPASGKLSVYLPTGTAHLTVDVQGYYTTAFGSVGGGFVPVAHTALADTRSGLGGATGTIAKGASRTFTLTGGVIPAGAASALVDLIVTDATMQGWIAAYAPGGSNNRSVMDYVPGTTAHAVAVPLGADGRVTITNNGGAPIHLLLTAEGYHTGSQTTGWGLRTTSASRIMDTRHAGDGKPVASRATIDVPLGLPAGSAAVLNLTVVSNSTGGYLRAWPLDGTEPATSVTNYPAPNTSPRAGLAVVSVGTDGTVRIRNVSSGTAHILVDLQAWFAPPIQ